MAHLLHDLVLEEGRELRRPLGSTGGAHSSALDRATDTTLGRDVAIQVLPPEGVQEAPSPWTASLVPGAH